ncbi:MAG TPA: cobalamin-binding protein [Candidatus Acidoferrales bacterium]|nr:cobalamin-binding protein [Candidatus Acidoferrales bacterium]
MRIVSLLPSSTEILFALGLGDSVVGVTHECDFPADAATKRVVVSSRLPENLGASEIDRAVRDFNSRGESIYHVDAEALRELAPGLIITQDLCHVCAASPGDLKAALQTLSRQPRVLSLNPHSLDDVWDDIRAVGAETDRMFEADMLVKQRRSQVERIARESQRLAAAGARPRVACLEWLDPFYNAGHWVPEMVAAAGGEDVLSRAGQPSSQVAWEEIRAAAPDVIFIMPCGYNLEKAEAEFAQLKLPAGWNDLPAVRNGNIFITDANSYFSRPGPRLSEGVAILASALRPEITVDIPENSIERFERSRTAAPR